MKIKAAIYTVLLLNLVSAVIVNADTRLINVRTGRHDKFTRVVLDSEGEYPLSVKNDSGNSLNISYANLILTTKEESRLIQKLDAAFLSSINHDKEVSHLMLSPQSNDARIETSYLSANPETGRGYRLVIDIYPQSDIAKDEKKSTPATVPVENNQNVTASTEETMNNVSNTGVTSEENTSENTEIISSGVIGKTKTSVSDASGDNELDYAGREKESADEPVLADNNSNAEVAITGGKKETPEAPVQTGVDISGKAEIILRNTSGERKSSKFDEYGDRAQPVTGSIEINRTRGNKSEIHIKMNNIGQEDQSGTLGGEIYGKVKIRAGYDELPHRYQYDARTLYSGIGSSYLALDDTMQSDMESTLFPDVDNKLSAYFQSAVSGDPVVTRKKGYLNMEWLNFLPFKFNLELKKEKRNGTIPRFGALGFSNTVELPAPVDYDSTQLRLNGELKMGSFLLNTSYYFSVFKNNNKFLLWDSPLTLNDYLFNSSKGQMGLPPDNSYHNVSISGLISNLPYYTRISANVAFGWMFQNDILAPYTVNSAIAAPDIPVGSIDGEVKTRLFNFLITSNPFNSMNLKLKIRSYEHQNNTTPITFTGFAYTDDFFNTDSPVINLPSSYRKDTIDAGIRKNLIEGTRLSLDYTLQNTKQSNREVSKQNERRYKISIDSTQLTWLYLRASYERTNRDSENYIFDSYLASGEDLGQNPLLRKYDEADMKRDRAQINMDITPWDKLTFSLSYIHGQDDFDKSTYGLLKDRHSIFSFDTNLALSENSNLHAFYSNEQYKNTTAGNGFVDTATEDWTAVGNDRVNTYGGKFTTRLLGDRLGLDLSYSYSKADGNLDFMAGGANYSQFTNVDDSEFHIFEGELGYRIGDKWICSMGFLWQKASYSDYNKDGFTYIPSDGSAIGYYQGAMLMGILPRDYDVNQVYLKVSHLF